MKYFTISYTFKNGSGHTGCVCDIYPIFEVVNSRVKDSNGGHNISIVNIIEMTKEQYCIFNSIDELEGEDES